MTEPAMTLEFPIGDFFSKAWGLALENVGVFIPAVLISMGLTMGCSFAGSLVSNVLVSILGMGIGGSLGNLLSIVIVAVVNGPLAVGMLGLARKVLHGQPATWSGIFAGFNYLPVAALASIAVSLLTVLGFALLVLPGMAAVLFYSATYFFVLDGEQSFWQAMESSRKLILENWMSWAMLLVLVALVNLAGCIPCLLGLPFTIPMSVLVLTQAYEMQRGLDDYRQEGEAA